MLVDAKLHDDVQDELNRSRAFEEKLLEATKSRSDRLDASIRLAVGKSSLRSRSSSLLRLENEAREREEKENDRRSSDSVEESLMGARYEPVVSILSPSLAFRAATTRNQWMRKENRSPAQAGGRIFEGSRKRRISSGAERGNRSFGGEDEVQSLQSRIEEDLNASRDFEKRLRAALEK